MNAPPKPPKPPDRRRRPKRQAPPVPASRRQVRSIPADPARADDPRAAHHRAAWAASRRQVLAEWRGVDLEPLERAEAIGARPTTDVVSNVLEELRLDQRRAETEILQVWNRLL